MASKFLTNIDLSENQILKARFETLAGSDPTNPFAGRMIYDSTNNVVRVYSGETSSWRNTVYEVTASSLNPAITLTTNKGTVTLSIANATSSVAGLMSASDKTKLDAATKDNTAGTLVLRDAVTGDFSAGTITTAKVTGLSSPVGDTDAANKAYVDAARTGLDVKASVRATTTGSNITLSGTQTIDGVSLVAGDRVLVKDQSAGSANGIYVVASGSWSRAEDADGAGEITPGMFTFVEEGTLWGDSGWVLTNNGTITIGTTALTFVQFSSAGQSIAGNGLTKSGNTIDVVGTTDRITVSADAVDIASTYAGQNTITTVGTIGTGTWQGSTIGIGYGGTNATSASAARSSLAATTAGGDTSTPVLARVAAKTITGAGTSFTVTHNFGTSDVVVQVFDFSTKETVTVDVVRTNDNVVTLTFASSPGANQYRVVVTG